MTSAYVVTGMLTDGRTVQLDEPLPLTSGRVRVTVEVAAATAAPRQTLQEWLEDLWRHREAEGRKPLTDAEIEEWVQDVRYGRGH